jgi:hypothetical protein
VPERSSVKTPTGTSGRLEQHLREPSPDRQQELFRDVKTLARAEGYGNVLDSWGLSLAMLRG